MKRVLLLAVFIFLLLSIFQLASAIQFDMKQDYAQGETILAKVSGNFLDNIAKENIYFYRGHVNSAFDYDVAKIDDDFYIYALTKDKTPANYSLVIRDVRYMQGANVLDEDIEKNFTITTDIAVFSVDPGFLFTNKDFSITLQNLQDSKIDVNVEGEDTLINPMTVTFKIGETKKIDFELLNKSYSRLEKLKFSSGDLSYDVLVYVIANISDEINKKSFYFEPDDLDITMSYNSSYSRPVYIHNSGDAILENISLTASETIAKYIFLSEDYIDDLSKDESFMITLNIDPNLTETTKNKTIEGYLRAKTGEGYNIYLFITLNFVPGYKPLEAGKNATEKIPGTTPSLPKNKCSDFDGAICASDETCDGELLTTSDGNCCLGLCEQNKTNGGSGTGKILGWGIVILVVLFLLWFFFKKYKKSGKGKVDLLKIAKKK